MKIKDKANVIMDQLNINKEISKYVQIAMDAIKIDDKEALASFLSNRISTNQRPKFGETNTTVEESASEDLLHMSLVKKAAVSCVRSLMNSPYLKEIVQCKAAVVVQEHANFPLVFDLKIISRRHLRKWQYDDQSNVNNSLAEFAYWIAMLVAFPHYIWRESVTHLQLGDTLYARLCFTSRLHFEKGSVDSRIFSACILLLNEIIVSAPSHLLTEGITYYKLWPWNFPKKHNATRCIDYPDCLIDPLIINERPKLRRIFYVWKAHLFVQNNDKQDENRSDEKTSNSCYSPLLLIKQCRLQIRRVLTYNLYYQAKVMNQHTLNSTLNYDTYVNKLSISRQLKDFLCYKDLWLVVS